MQTISRTRVLLCAFVVSCAGAGVPRGAPPRPSSPPPVASAPPPGVSARASASPIASAPAPAPSASAPRRPGAMLTQAEKRDLIQRFADAFNAHDAARLTELYTRSASGTFAAYVDMPTETGYLHARTLEPVMHERQKLFDALPDVRMNLGRVYVSPGSVLTFEWVLTATDTKGLRGARPTNAKIGVRAVTTIWYGPAEVELVGSEGTYFDFATIFGQASGARDVRPVATPPPKATEWLDSADDYPEGQQDTDGVDIHPFWGPFVKHDLKAFAAVLADDFVWRDLTRRDDIVGRDAMLAELMKRAKVGPWPTESSGGGAAPDTTWDTTRGGKKTTLHTADVIEWRKGKAVSLTTFGNALER